MSHITTVKTQIRDIEALREAAARLGCVLEGPGSVVGYYGEMGKADHVLRIPGTRYTVGFNKQPDGSYAVMADFWGGYVERVLGRGCGRLLQEYALAVFERVARKARARYSVERKQDGRILIRVSGSLRPGGTG